MNPIMRKNIVSRPLQFAILIAVICSLAEVGRAQLVDLNLAQVRRTRDVDPERRDHPAVGRQCDARQRPRQRGVGDPQQHRHGLGLGPFKLLLAAA